MRLTPLVKGIITAAVMIAISLAVYYTDGASGFGYLIYAAYLGGIIWTLVAFARQEPESRTFGKLFNQGFRCFIVVTLVMVAFTALSFILHPEWADEAATKYRADLVKEGNKTPAEIDKIIETAKDQFTISNVGFAIFGYLITGAVMTAAVSGIIIIRRNN